MEVRLGHCASPSRTWNTRAVSGRRTKVLAWFESLFQPLKPLCDVVAYIHPGPELWDKRTHAINLISSLTCNLLRVPKCSVTLYFVTAAMTCTNDDGIHVVEHGCRNWIPTRLELFRSYNLRDHCQQGTAANPGEVRIWADRWDADQAAGCSENMEDKWDLN